MKHIASVNVRKNNSLAFVNAVYKNCANIYIGAYSKQ